MGRITSRLAVVAVTAAMFVVPVAAHAAAAAHECGIGSGGWVTASGDTSCPFARDIAHAWVRGDCYRHDGFCHGQIYSPVTDRWYMVDCRTRSHWPERVFCWAPHGNNAWIRFVERND